VILYTIYTGRRQNVFTIYAYLAALLLALDGDAAPRGQVRHRADVVGLGAHLEGVGAGEGLGVGLAIPALLVI
jgi:hypothetical protein